jgi:hypothetical protein
VVKSTNFWCFPLEIVYIYSTNCPWGFWAGVETSKARNSEEGLSARESHTGIQTARPPSPRPRPHDPAPAMSLTAEPAAAASTDPLLAPNPQRFVLFPIKYHQVWEMYKKHEVRAPAHSPPAAARIHMPCTHHARMAVAARLCLTSSGLPATGRCITARPVPACGARGGGDAHAAAPATSGAADHRLTPMPWRPGWAGKLLDGGGG